MDATFRVCGGGAGHRRRGGGGGDADRRPYGGPCHRRLEPGPGQHWRERGTQDRRQRGGIQEIRRHPLLRGRTTGRQYGASHRPRPLPRLRRLLGLRSRAYVQQLLPSFGDAHREVQTPSLFCPTTVNNRTDANIHISETAFSIPDRYKVTVVDSDETNGNPSTAYLRSNRQRRGQVHPEHDSRRSATARAGMPIPVDAHSGRWWRTTVIG